MGVQADTATAVMNKWPDLGGANGFTDGDPQAGVDATQCSDGWFNNVTEEINAFIALVSDGQVVPAFDEFSLRQMALAFFVGLTRQLGTNTYGDVLWSRRTFPASTVTAAEKDWRTWVRDTYVKAGADNTVHNVGALVLPNDSQAFVEWVVVVVKTTDISVRLMQKIRASIRKTGATASVQHQEVAYTEGTLVVTITIDSSGGTVRAEVDIGALGSTYNIHAAVTAVNVTTSTAA